MNLIYTYAGSVENNQDPEKLGRLKVRVPHVYGIDSGTTGYIGTNDLPWAMPAGLPAGGSPESGGFTQLPTIGDRVWVRFLDGEPEKPIWEWGMQTFDHRDTLKLHTYEQGTGRQPVGRPNRTAWTRYSHAIEINAGSIIATTSAGYRVVWTDATTTSAFDGNIKASTPMGNFWMLDDLDDTYTLNVMADCKFNIMESMIGLSNYYSWKTTSDSYEVKSGSEVNFDSLDGFHVTTSADFTVDALDEAKLSSPFVTVVCEDFELTSPIIKLGSAGATEPYVLGTQLTTWITQLLEWCDLHEHLSGAPGEETSPPTGPAPPPGTILSAVITGQ
jgi:hypothetical protein